MQLVDNKAVYSLEVCCDHRADFFMHGTTVRTVRTVKGAAVKGAAARNCSWNMTLNYGIVKLCLHARGEVQGCQGDGNGDDHERGKDISADMDNLSKAGLPPFGCSRKMPAPIGTAG